MDSLRVVQLRFDVLRVDLPAEPVRYSPKVWNHVDELRMDVDLAAHLARNGIRVGVASREAWPALRAIFEAGGAHTVERWHEVRGGNALEVVLASVQEAETIFAYGRKNRLSGKTVPSGDRMMRIDYLFHPELGGCTELNIYFEIRRDLGVMTWESHDGVISQVPSYDWHRFDSLSVPLTLNPEEFLVIGPSAETRNEYLVGSRFFRGQRAGQRCETVLCITPRPYQVETTTR